MAPNMARRPLPAFVRLGFTLVELLVVIAIIGVLVSLLLPAVQAAREAGRRAQCANNLKQLGLAVMTYENTHKVLPPGGIIQKNPNPTITNGEFDPLAGKMFSWIVLILPFMEQGNLQDQFDFRVPIFQQPRNPQATRLETLTCPSDGGTEIPYMDATWTQGRSFAKGNYAAWVSPFHVDLQNFFAGALGGDGHPLAAITDGTSNTLMISEVRTRGEIQDQRGAWALPWNGASQLAFDMHDDDGQSPFRYNPGSIPYGVQPPNNTKTGNADMLYVCSNPAAAQLEKMPCLTWQASGPFQYLSCAARSRHVNGVETVYADGHVGLLSDNIDYILMSYLICVDEHEVALPP